MQAISSGINQAISTVQNSGGQMGGPPLSPGPAPALSPAGSPITAFSGAQGVTSAPVSTGGSSSPNTGAIVGGGITFSNPSSLLELQLKDMHQLRGLSVSYMESTRGHSHNCVSVGVVGGVVGLSVILGLATWLVMRRRQINTSGSSDEESPYGHKDQDYGGPRGLHASESHATIEDHWQPHCAFRDSDTTQASSVMFRACLLVSSSLLSRQVFCSSKLPIQ